MRGCCARRTSTPGDILGSTTSAFLAVTLMDVWEWTPLIALIVLAGLSALPTPVIEASRVDGATYWQRLRHIVCPMISLPHLRPRLRGGDRPVDAGGLDPAREPV